MISMSNAKCNQRFEASSWKLQSAVHDCCVHRVIRAITHRIEDIGLYDLKLYVEIEEQSLL